MAWDQACKSYLEKFLKLQKQILCFTYFSKQNQHTIPLLFDGSVLPLKCSYYELLSNLMLVFVTFSCVYFLKT